jgi:coproporphyrinogen III oxidase-like Fe-S oxidoreductase
VGTALSAARSLTRSEEADEFLLMGLRLVEGIELARYEHLSGQELSRGTPAILQGEGLVAPIGNSRLRVTPAGMIVLDAVVADLAR